ncbi:MAG: TonB-dependent receptor [Taibaiella sp.]|nr:TonB-dependent receptor [Taibaiella sp.]
MRSALLLAIAFITCSAYAQSARNITGVIKDSTGKPVTNVVITLLQASDSSWVATQLSADDGAFTFKDVTVAKYIIDARSLEFAPVQVVVANINPVIVTLKKNTASLKDVVITATKPLIELGLGKTTINVENSITNAGLNVLDLLKKSPGITVSANSNISMLGKNGVQVMINERPTYLSGQELADYLKTLSANEVAQLELITQPSSRYDAEGNAGIINIRLKRNNKIGFNGNGSVTYGQSVYPWGEGDMRVNYRKGKMNLYLTGSTNNAIGFADWTETETFKDDNNNVTGQRSFHSHPVEHFATHSSRIGADYEYSSASTFGGSFSGTYHTNTNRDDISYRTIDLVNKDTVYSLSRTPDNFVRKDLAANAYYTTHFSKQSDLNLNFDYLLYINDPHQRISTSSSDANMLPLPGNIELRSAKPTDISVYSVKADYTNMLTDSIKLEAGIKTSFVSTGNNSMFDIYRNGVWQPDTTRSNHFIYNENINALYLSLNKAFSSRWSAQAGMRAENTNSKGTQLVHEQTLSRSYVSFFPTAYISYKLDSANEFQLNYGRRIDRPAYQTLNPFIYYSFQYNYFVGNPYLQPQYTNSLELKHSYKNQLITTISYAATNNAFNDILAKDTAGIIFSTTKNIASSKVLHCSVLFSKEVYNWWMLNMSASAFYAEYIGVTGIQSTKATGTGYVFHTSSQFTLPSGWKTELMYYFVGTSIAGLTSIAAPTQYISVGVSKKFGSDSTLSLNVSDTFYINTYAYHDTLPGFETRTTYRGSSRAATLTYAYNFGKKAAQHQADAPDETKRMRIY